MHILPIINLNFKKYKSDNKSQNNSTIPSFGASQRVDKGMDRFFDFNKGKMPITLLTYLDGVENKNMLTPLQAQRQAFEMLSIVDTVEDIKDVFPDEPLFADLKTVDKTKSTSGILWMAKKYAPLMDELGIAPLKSKEDFTVYLVKKVFLETKTLKEINKDLDNDLDDLFKSEYKAKYPQTPYVSRDTFKALGIKAPNSDYMNSLKFTREGYSDEIGEVISLANKIYWDSLTQEQRDALAKKSTEKLENWWSSLTENEKLEMIAQDENTLKMLEEYNEYKHENSQPTERKPQVQKTSVESETTDSIKTSHTRVGSEVLDKDAFFKRWASNKLAIYEAGLSPEERTQLEIKRARNAAARWTEMSPAEKAQYISKLKSGSEAMRYTMIDAWNNSFDLLVDLSDFLSEKMVEKPVEAIYSKEAFGEFMSEIMTEFWALHTEEAKEFGKEISKAWHRVDEAYRQGTFDTLRNEIMQKRKIRMFDLQRYKLQKKSINQKLQETEKVQVEQKPEISSKQIIEDNISARETAEMLKKANELQVLRSLGLTEKAIDSIQKTHEKPLSQKQKKQELGYSLLGVMLDTVIPLARKFSDIPESITDEELDAQGIKVTERVKPEYRQDYDSAVSLVSQSMIYVLDKYFMKRTHGANTSYANYLMDILPQLKSDTKKITYYDQSTGKTETILHAPGYVNIDHYINQYKEYLKHLTEQEAQQIMKKYFPKEINGKPVDMTDENREKVYNFIKNSGVKYLKKVFSEGESPIIYPMQENYYTYFKAVVPDVQVDDIKGILDTDEYKKVFKNKTDMIKKLRTNEPYLPEDFCYTYLGLALSGIADKNYSFDKFENAKLSKMQGMMINYKTSKANATLEEKVKVLCMEQALSCVLNKSMQEEKLFGLEFEDLNNLAHTLYNAKRFPYKTLYPSAFSRQFETLSVEKRPDFSKIEQMYQNYLEECNDWLENIQTDPSLSKEEKIEELLYILNPNENWTDIDPFIQQRIQRYKIAEDIL